MTELEKRAKLSKLDEETAVYASRTKMLAIVLMEHIEKDNSPKMLGELARDIVPIIETRLANIKANPKYPDDLYVAVFSDIEELIADIKGMI